MSELNPLIDRLNGIIKSITSARKSLAKIATKVRTSQAARIKDNKNPDGGVYEQRKPQRLRANKGAIRRMFEETHPG